MSRSGVIVLGIGLIVLWIAGLGSPSAQPWMTWLDGIAGMIAFYMATHLNERAARSMRFGGPVAVGAALFVMFVIGLVTRVSAWQNWWNFAFACLFFLVGAMAVSTRAVDHAGPTASVSEIGKREEQNRFGKSA